MTAVARRARGGGSRATFDATERDHLSLLYEVSQILATTRSTATAAATVFDVLRPALRLRGGVLVLDCAAARCVRSWPDDGARTDEMRLARARARHLHAFLAGGRPHRDPERTSAGAYIALPLVVSGGPVFGLLQVEPARTLEERDLAFFNAAVNQLAVEIARRSAVIAERAAERARRLALEAHRDAAERDLARQRFLAEVGAILGGSLDSRATVAASVSRAVPFLADICLVDEYEGGSRKERLGAAFAGLDDLEMAERVAQAVARQGSGDRPVLIPEHTLMPGRTGCLVGIPLVAHGERVGLLALASVQSGRRYGAPDLTLADEFGRRLAMNIANARLHQRAELAIRQRQDVLAMVSHDLRSPLNAILFVAQSVLRTPPAADRRKSDRHKAEIVKRCAERMNRMIQDLLDLSSIEAGRLSLDVQATALAPVIQAAVDGCADAATAKRQHLDLKLPDGQIVVRCDGGRIIQVLSNLLGNAIKFTPAGGGLGVSTESRGREVLVHVTDTGPGIPSTDQAHVFERYWQARETASKGNGLGLFIAKGIVEAHGGSIGVHSTPGLGATFWFTLPVAS